MPVNLGIFSRLNNTLIYIPREQHTFNIFKSEPHPVLLSFLKHRQQSRVCVYMDAFLRNYNQLLRKLYTNGRLMFAVGDIKLLQSSADDVSRILWKYRPDIRTQSDKRGSKVSQ